MSRMSLSSSQHADSQTSSCVTRCPECSGSGSYGIWVDHFKAEGYAKSSHFVREECPLCHGVGEVETSE